VQTNNDVVVVMVWSH